MKQPMRVVHVLLTIVCLLCVDYIFGNAVAAQSDALVLTEEEQAWLSDHPDVIIAFDGDYAPYSFIDENGEFGGIAVDFANALAERAGFKLKIYPDGHWNRLYSAAQQRHVDVVATLVKRPKREQWFEFTAPYLSLAQYVITTRENEAISERAQIAGKTFALVKGYSSSGDLLEEFPSIHPFYVDDLSEALEAVLTGKADATLADMGIAQHLIAQRGFSNLKFAVRYAQGKSDQSFGVRNDWPELVSILERALASLSYAERIEIFQRWSHPEIAKATVVRTRSIINHLSAKERAWLQENPVVRVGAMEAWPPFNFVDKQGRASGIGRDLFDALNQRLEGVLTIVPGPWDQIYADVTKGGLGAVMDITPKQEREKDFHFTSPYLDIPHVIVARIDTSYLNNEDDLAGKTLALENGFGNVAYFRNNYPKVNIKEYRDTALALDAVARGEADAYAGNRAVALYLIERELMVNLEVHGRLKKTGSILAFGVRRDQPIFRDILQKALDDLPQHDLQALLRNWVHPRNGNGLDNLHLSQAEKDWLAEHHFMRAGIDHA
ncbi:MAG: transporter substrate-binding domain-containing protein, partial [Pseudomonadota bacterium]